LHSRYCKTHHDTTLLILLQAAFAAPLTSPLKCYPQWNRTSSCLSKMKHQ
jgi:hypothetical protein